MQQQAWHKEQKLQQASTGSDKLDSSNAGSVGSGNALEEKEDLFHRRRTRPTSVPLISHHQAQLGRTSALAAPEVSGVKLKKTPKLVTGVAPSESSMSLHLRQSVHTVQTAFF